MILTTLVLNRDLFKLLMFEYEFWLFTILNVAYWCILGSTLGETRWLVAIPGFINTQLIISIDANIRTLQVMLPGTLIWIPAAICFCIICFIPVIDVDSSQFWSLLPPGRMVLTRINVLTNICITLCLFTARRCYIKRSVLAKHCADTTLIPCAVIRAKLRMFPKSTRTLLIQPNPGNISREKYKLAVQATQATQLCCSSTRIRPSSTTIPQSTIQLQLLELVPRKFMNVDASQTLALDMPPPLSPPLHLFSAGVLYLLGIVGLLLSVYGVIFIPQTTENGFILSALALATTTMFITPFVLSFQRAILKTLVRNFDVAFLLVEAILCWIGFSFAIQWDARSLAAFSALLWVQFTLLVDALTPIIRVRFRFRKAFLAPVVVLLVANTVGLVVNLASTSIDSFLPDRELICARMFRHDHCLHTASFVLQRLVTLVIWMLRLLWALFFGDDDELMFLRAVTRFVSPVEMLPFRRNLQADL